MKTVKIKDCALDGKKIYIQSMLSVRSDDIEGNVSQAVALERAGCEILRVAIPNKDALNLIPAIKAKISIPLVADIHYDYRLALSAVDIGIDKIRINPGNIGDKDRIKAVAEKCKSKNIPLRIGVNNGSLEKNLDNKDSASALVESAQKQVALLEEFGFDDIVISLKSSDVTETVKAYRQARQLLPYPLHLGITEAGTEHMGRIKSAIGIGSLLLDNIGETIRVSLTANPIMEIQAAKDILKAVGKGEKSVEIISCPTCGRTRIDIIHLANEIEEATAHVNKKIKIAVMGCAVNGIGEGRQADIGIAGGDGCAVIFRNGEIIRKVPEDKIITELLRELDDINETV